LFYKRKKKDSTNSYKKLNNTSYLKLMNTRYADVNPGMHKNMVRL